MGKGAREDLRLAWESLLPVLAWYRGVLVLVTGTVVAALVLRFVALAAQ